MEIETKKKLLEAISLIVNTAQNEQSYDRVITNEWDTIEAQARDLRESIEELETEEQYNKREERRRQQNE